MSHFRQVLIVHLHQLFKKATKKEQKKKKKQKKKTPVISGFENWLVNFKSVKKERN